MRMRRLLLTFLIMLTAMNVSPQSLSPRHRHLGTVACLAAQGDLTRLEPALTAALNDGVTINELKETLSHLYAYVGFPRSLNALGVLSRVLQHPDARWLEGKLWVRPSMWNHAQEALVKGTQIQTRLSGGKPFDYPFCPQIDHYLKAHLFGDIFAGAQLSPADREIVTVGALSGLKGVEPQLEAHKRGAVALGNTKEMVDELCAYLSANGLSQTDSAADAQAGAWPQGAPNDAYARYFTGNSYLAPLRPVNLTPGEQSALPGSVVTFEPGCRNNWHVHKGCKQVLICVSGHGWYQEWGKPAIALQTGDVVEIPEGVKHWHGARNNAWFQHIAYHIPTGGPIDNRWLEPVSDEQYNGL